MAESTSEQQEGLMAENAALKREIAVLRAAAAALPGEQYAMCLCAVSMVKSDWLLLTRETLQGV